MARGIGQTCVFGRNVAREQHGSALFEAYLGQHVCICWRKQLLCAFGRLLFWRARFVPPLPYTVRTAFL